MPIVLLVVAIALVAFFAYRARPRAGAAHDAHAEASAEHLSVEHHPGTDDPMSVEERVETGAIIDAWLEVLEETSVDAQRAGEVAIIERCDALLATLDDREGLADVDTATSALRAVLSMALSHNSQHRNCVEILREQPVPDSLLEPQQRSVHPFPLLARSLARLGEYDEALSVLDADEALDDRRDPDSAVHAAAARDEQRAMIAFSRGDYAAARAILALEADGETTHGTDIHRMSMLAAMAQLDQETGALEQAWDEATEAQTFFVALGGRAGGADTAAIDIILARIEVARGDAASARDRAAAARDALTPLRAEGWTEATITLASAERHLGLLDDAFAHATEALATATELETVPLIAQARAELGKVQLARGEHDAAVAHLEVARALFTEMGCAPRAAAVATL